jgi:thymidine phosphorylase
VFGNVALKLGAGRNTKEDVIDFEAGIELKKITNDFINSDLLLLTYL